MHVTTVNGVTAHSGMSPQEIFNAHLVKQGHPGLDLIPKSEPQFHTDGTAARMAQGDAEAKLALNQKPIAAIKAAFNSLDAKQQETHRAAFEADLKVLWTGEKAPGHFEASLDKALRDTRMQQALTAALAENKSPEELKAIIDGAATSPLPGRDANGRYTAKHITGDEAVRMFVGQVDKSNALANGTLSRADFDKFYKQLRVEGYAVRTLPDGGLQVYNPKAATEIAGKSRTQIHIAQPAAPVSEYTPEQWADGHQSVTDAEGWIPVERINPDALSGYTLPRLVPDQVYAVGIFATLRDARAAGVTQEQLTAFITNQMRADGWLKA